MGNWKEAINERIAQVRAERRRLNEQAALEYLEHGNTKRFRRLWRQVAAQDHEKECLEVLAGTRQDIGDPRKIGFVTDEPPCPTDYDAPPDTEDDDEDELFDEEEDAPRGNEIYCSRKESRRW